MSESDIGTTYEAAETADSSQTEELAIEAPEADAVEQHTLVRPNGEPAETGIPFDADEADAAEQRRVVEVDDDDYDYG
jgi:hypothetical protein